MLCNFKDFALGPSLFEMLLLNKILLPHGLHRIVLFGTLTLAQHYLPKGSTSQYL